MGSTARSSGRFSRIICRIIKLKPQGLHLESDGHQGVSEAGAPALTFPESALIEATHHLKVAIGQGILLEDYAEAAVPFFGELAKNGWSIFPPTVGARGRDTSDRLACDGSVPLGALIEARRRAGIGETSRQ
jgi:hypothetical protein